MGRPLLLVSTAAFLLMLGLGVLFPVLPFFTRSLGLSELQTGVLIGGYAATSVVMSPLWGRVSQRIGRRLPIVVGLAGFGVAFGLFGLGQTFAQLLGARLLGGVFAAAALPAIYAYVADVTAPERRSAAMGAVGAAIGLGVVAGPLAGSLLAPLGLRVPFFASAGLALAAACAVAAALPESLPAAERASAATRSRSRVTTREVASELAPFLVFIFLVQTARMSVESTLGFLVADRLRGGPVATGLLLGALGLLAVAIQGGAIGPLAARLGDARLLRAGVVLTALGLAGIGLARGWAATAGSGVVLATGHALVLPSFNAILSRAAERAQGEAQGLKNGAESLGRVVGPVLFTALYQGRGAALAYVVAAVVCAAALPVARAALIRESSRRGTARSPLPE